MLSLVVATRMWGVRAYGCGLSSTEPILAQFVVQELLVIDNVCGREVD